MPQFTVAYFGCHYAGNPVVPLNVLLTAEELAYHLDDSEAMAVVVWESFLGPVQEAVARSAVRTVIVAKADLADPSAPQGSDNLTALMGGSTPVDAAHPTRRRRHRRHPLHVGHHRPGQGRRADPRQPAGQRQGPSASSLGADTAALVALPLFHAFGMTVMHNAVLAVGGTLVLLPRFSAGAAAALIARHRVTFFGGVPTMYIALLHEAGPGRPVRPAVVRLRRRAHAGRGDGRLRAPLRRVPPRGLRPVGDVAGRQLHRPGPAPNAGSIGYPSPAWRCSSRRRRGVVNEPETRARSASGATT